jgi:hypothetical protein
VLLYVEAILMAQMHFYVPDPIAKQLRARAKTLGLTVSRYLAAVVRKEVGEGWPEGYFEEVVGHWEGEPLLRPPQAAYEDRKAL